MTEKLNINTQLIAFEKSIDFISEGAAPSSATSMDGKEEFTDGALIETEIRLYVDLYRPIPKSFSKKGLKTV